MDTSAKPMSGVRVLEFSTMITASLAAMTLAEQGADVIKVEPMELGDPMRFLGSQKGGISALFANCNRGKQSLRIELKSEEGRSVIQELVKDMDILLCNYRPGVMDKLGLGSEALRRLNPRLIYAAITGFGTAGPDKDAPAYDPIIQAQSGFTAVQGGEDGPKFVRNLTCDKITAYTACQAVTAALYVREKTGAGQHVDLSMMDAGLFFLFPDGFMHHTLLDEDAEHHPPLSELLYDLVPTKDGGITVSAASMAQQVGLVTALDKLHLFADERFNSQEKVLDNVEAFRTELVEAAEAFTTEELLARLKEQDVPAARCYSYQEVLAHPQYAANGSIDQFQHPLMGQMLRVRLPARFGGQSAEPGTASPAHGEHTLSILRSLGRTDKEIEALQNNKVV